jgi:2'-5' RNA ligase
LKRTFIAVDIPVNDTVNSLLNKLRHELEDERIKWIKPEQFHITLQFLGDTEEPLINSVDHALDRIAGNISGFTLKLTEFGVFKNLRNPRILWIGFVPSKELERLKYAVNDKMFSMGFEKPDKQFSPHLTIGRIKHLRNRHSLAEWIDKYREAELQEIRIEDFVYYESILKPEGPEYVAINRYSLKYTRNLIIFPCP